MLPARKRSDAPLPRLNVRERAVVDAGVFLVVLVADEREIGDRELVADEERASRQVLVDDRERAQRAFREEVAHRRIARLHQSDHPAQRCVVARELVIVEQEPSEDRETLLFVLPAELAAALREMREDGAALCDAFA